MIIIHENGSAVNETIDLPCPETCPRRQEQLRRVLGLIDLLASASRHQTTHEIQRAYNDRHGTTWHWRTIQRDLECLRDNGLMDVEIRQDFGDKRTATRFWLLDLEESEPLQEAAIKLDSELLASGERDLWKVFVLDLETQETYQLWHGLTLAEVNARMALWRYSHTNCLLFPLPESSPLPSWWQLTENTEQPLQAVES